MGGEHGFQVGESDRVLMTEMGFRKRLVLGGARSGKSRHALALAEGFSGNLVFIATAEAIDDEMADRIEQHQAERSPRWHAVDAPVALASAIGKYSRADTLCLVDCLTVWLSNLYHYEKSIEAATKELCDAIDCAAGPIILVSNEVGLGLVPETPLGRQFRDEQGRLNQRMAAHCDTVDFVAAGLPLKLKG